MIRWAAAVIGVAAAGAWAAGVGEQPYKSPYEVKFTHPHRELVADLDDGPRGDRREQSSVPFREWDSRLVREKWGAWGPPARHYPAPAILADRSVAWRRERAVAVALRFVGYGYQHHHIPDWDPPRDWPWLKVQAGHNGKGVDCSNYLSFVYNLGFGIRPDSGIKQLAAQREMPGPGDRPHRTEHIPHPGSYEGWAKVLKPGDLLFIKGSETGPVSHVVMWVGPIGRNPEPDVPLVIDSHGQGVKDSAGASIPAGVHVRPFRPKSWYAHDASHATRVLTGE